MAARKNSTRKKEPAEVPPVKAKRVVLSQTEFPRTKLQTALGIAEALWENYAGDGASPPDVALAMDISPTSSAWRDLCGSSAAYGLTEGGYNAQQIKLTALGRRAVAPQTEGDDLAARVEAIQKPRIMRAFFQKYRRAKLPNDTIAANVLVSFGLPKERSAKAFEIVKQNGAFCGVVRDTKTGPFVHIDSPHAADAETVELEDAHSEGAETADLTVEEIASRVSGKPPDAPAAETDAESENNRVFITHGQNRGVVDQLKELLTFGKLEPVVSVERESTAIPVPEKVFQDMRSCAAGVIHVNSEGELLDAKGKKHIHINQNVLIEIGAAVALYGKKVVLLVEKGVKLPSNLQGLYRCEYEGDRLDYDATMKLLKTFNQFR